jgi:RHS repeat-associated protein
MTMVLVLSWTWAMSTADAEQSGGFPPIHLPTLAQLASWVESPHWGLLPEQASGSAAGKSHTASAVSTRADRGVGRAPGKGKGQLPNYTTYEPPLKPGKAGAHAAGGVFNVKTSKRVGSKSSATLTYWQNADGSITKDESEYPVNYQAKPGDWEPIDASLVRGSDGRYAERANSLGVSFADRSGPAAVATPDSSIAADAAATGSGELSQVQISSSESVGWSLQGANAVAPVVSGSSAAYDGILSDTNVIEQAGPTGVKESIVLSSASAADSWTFPLEVSGLTASIDATGAVAFEDSSGAVVARVPLAYAFDSDVNDETGLPATTWGVSYALSTVDGAPALTVSVDPAWLDDPARVFPVTVDPSLSVSIVGTTSTTYVNTDNSVDHSSSTYLETGECTASACGNLDNANGLIDFANSRQLDDQGYTVTAASVNLFDNWTAVSVGSAECTSANQSEFTWSTIDVAPITQGWAVTGAKGYPGPSVGAVIGSAAPATWAACTNTGGSMSTGNWVSVPVSASWAQSVSYGQTPDYGVEVYGPSGGLSWRLYDSDVESSYTPYLSITYTDQAPQVTALYPPNGYAAPTLTPELMATAVKAPNSQSSTAFTYQFTVFNGAGTAVATSASLATPDWTVPSGDLSWSTTYYWTVEVGDGISSSVPQPLQSLTVAVPQPTVTSLLSQDTSDQGFDAASGNYTTSTTDANVSVVGPSLEIDRDYNAQDPRVAGAFGAAWSSVLDARAVEVDNAAGAVTSVTVRYPDGSEVGFGLNSNGTYAPPAGRFATFNKVTGGYTLTDKNDTVYTFTQSLGSGAYGITSVADANGRALDLVWSSGEITTMTSVASQRSLHLTWSTPTGATAPHVATVYTDPVTPGNSSTDETWQYNYSGDQLTSVCQPNSTPTVPACTAYTYTTGNAYQSAALDAGPHTLWPLNETSGTVANDAVLANEGADNATYTNVTLAASATTTPFSSTATTSASFNGTSSYVTLPSSLVNGASYEALSLWFKTTSDNGVLFSYSGSPVTSSTTAGNYTPSLYVGSDGKLNAEYWYSSGATPVVSAASVADGKWHHVAISAAGSTQTVWLDGTSIGTLSGTVSIAAGVLASTQVDNYVGAGFIGGNWPDEAHHSTTSNTGYATFFNGSIADVAFYTRPLVQTDVTALYGAGEKASNLLTGITRPSGKAYATITYNPATSRATHLTDENGGGWTIDTPTVKGSSDVYRSAVMGSNPAGYYRLNDPAGSTLAVSQENYGYANYNGGVTLGTAGPFPDQTAAKFDGSSGYVQLPTTDQVSTGPNSVEMWFKVPAGNTAGGVLFDEEQDSLTSSNPAGGGYDPALYVGTDGRLHGEFWVNDIPEDITSTSLVNDGAWHYVVLSASSSSQTLYLDGNSVGTAGGTLSATGLGYIYVGAGESGGDWPFHPANTLGYFTGSIAEVAFYRSQLQAADVADHYAAYKSGVANLAPTEYATVVDPGGKTLTYEYDLLNDSREISYTDGDGSTTTYGYDSNGFQDTTTDADGNVTVQGHDVRGNVVSQTTCQWQAGGDCSTAYYSYLPNDTTNPLTTASPTNDELATSSDGRSASSTDPTYETKYGYDAYGDQTTTTTPPVPGYPNGRVTTVVYSTPVNPVLAAGSATVDIPNGLPVKTVSPGGAVSTVAYLADGDVAASRDADGLVTEYTYDGIGEVLTKTTLPDKPVGWWPLTQTSGTGVEDSSPAGNNLTASNVTWNGTSGSFNGTSSQIVAPGPILNTSTDFSVSAWANLTTANSNYQVVATVQGTNTAAMQLLYAGNTKTWAFSTESADIPSPTYNVAAQSTAPATGTWTHLVGVYSASAKSVSLYVNGTLAGSQYAPAGFAGIQGLTIGSTNGANYFGGSISDVQVYQRALSATDVSNLYAAGHDGTVVADTTPSGLVTSYQYDKMGEVIQEADPGVTDTLNGADTHTAVTATTYDLDGDITAQTVSDVTGGDAPRTTSSTYNQYDQVATSTDANANAGDANGATTTYTYDAYGNKTKDVDQDGNTTQYTYDADGNLLTQGIEYTGNPVDPSSATFLTESSRAYDPAGRLASITDSMGNVTSYTYGDDGLTATITRTDPTGKDVYVLQSNQYDAAGNLTEQTTNNGATVTDYTVDAADRTTSTTEDPDDLARTTTVSYTPDDEVATATETDPSGYDRTTSATYDPMGNTTSQTVSGDSTGHPTAWYPLTQTSGSTVTDASGTGNTANTTGVTWTGSAAQFGGTTGQQITTNGPVLNTTASYSVSAWAELNNTSGWEDVVSQDSSEDSGFYLQYDTIDKAWSFSQVATNTASPTAIRAHGSTTPTTGTWYHLVGVYNASNGAMQLYVNGALAGSATNTAPFASNGGLAIGRGQYDAAPADLLNGSVSNVQVYPQALTAAQVTTLYGNGRNGGTLGSSSQQTTSWTYDPRGLQTSMTDPDGNTTGYVYDQAGQLAATVNPPVSVETNGGSPVVESPVSQTQYDTFGEPVQTQDLNGNETEYAYDADGQKVSETEPGYTPPGSSTATYPTTVWTYDALGDVTSVAEPDGQTTSTLYDQLGDVAQVTDPDNGTTDYTYDTNGDKLSTTDPTGAQTQATYDWMGRQLTSTQLERYPAPQSLTTTDSYAPTTGNPEGAFLSSEQTPDGVTTSYGYDNLGEMTSQTDAVGNTTKYAYDFTGQPYTTTYPDGTHTETDYDAEEAPVAQKTFDSSDHQLTLSSTVYDGDGNVLSTTDPNGYSTTFTYDASGQVSQEVQPVSAGSSITTSFGYDADGNLTRYTDGRGNSWHYTYNPLNLMQTEVEPETSTYDTAAQSTTTYSYNGDGQLTNQVNPSGASVSLSYDGDGDVTNQSGTGATAATAARSFTYDGDGDVLTAGTSAAGTQGSAGYQPATNESFTYDDSGSLLTAGGSAGSSSFGYNGDGLMTSQADAAGTTSYTYDGDDRLASLSDPATGTDLTYGYNDMSQPSSVKYGSSGDTRSYTYNGSHELASDTLDSPTGTAVASIQYGYDDDGNLTSKATSGFDGSADNTYTYDEADRLTSWDNGTATTQYAYDASSNRIQVGSNVYTYDARDELTSDGVNSYSYTADGALATETTTSGADSYTTDAYGQQITAGAATYGLDASGRDITDAVSGAGGSSRTFQYDGASDTIASDGSNTYTYDPSGGLVGINQAGATSTSTGVLAMTDQHDDVVGDFTNTGTALSGSTTYDPLGNVTATSDQVGSLGYESGWRDSSTGKVDMGSRWYNPATGQFMNKDSVSLSPVPNSVAANPFAYVDDNPMAGTDPSGHCWVICSVINDAKHAYHKVASKVASAFKKIAHAAAAVVENSYNEAKRAASDVVRAAKRTVSVATGAVSDAYRAATTEARRVYRYTAKKVRRVYRAAVHVVKTAYHAVAKAAKTATTYVKHHAAAITSFVVSTAVFVGCEAATAGIGTVGCAAAAGAVGSLVNQGFKCASGASGACSVDSFAESAVTGAVTGALGGALGEVGGSLLGKLAPEALDAVGGLFGKGLSDAGEDALDGAGGDAADDATQEASDADSAESATSSVDGSSGDAPQSEAQQTGDPKAGDDSGSSCTTNHSFTGSTQVLMADGTTESIDQVRVGDKIANSVPGQSGTQTNTVTGVIVTYTDHDFVDVTLAPVAKGAVSVDAGSSSVAATGKAKQSGAVKLLRRSVVALAAALITVAAGAALTAHVASQPGAGVKLSAAAWSSSDVAPAAGSLAQASAATASVTSAAAAVGGGTLTTTFTHPFYDITQAAFVDAQYLHLGDRLQTPTGTAAVTDLHLFHANTTTYDLTIGALHTFYVVAGSIPVLVHNCGDDDNPDLVNAVQTEYNNITDPDSPGYQSIRQRGPVLTGVQDNLTGEIRLSQNYGGMPDNLHPSLTARIGEFGGDDPYPGSSGWHGEIYGLNDLLWARDDVGLSTEIDDSFTFYSLRLRGSAQGEQILRCGSCATITNGAGEL